MDGRAELDVARLHRRLQRETGARLEAEAIAERSLRESYQHQQEIALLESIAGAANEAQEVGQAMGRALRDICGYAHWPVGHALLASGAPVAPGSHLASMRLWHMDAGDRHKRFRESTEELRFLPDEGLPGRVWTSGHPAWIIDVTTDSNFPRAPAARRCGLKAGFAFPVLVGSEAVAVLEFFAEQALAPDERLLRIMAQVGTQLGRVVERQRARERLQYEALHDALTALANRALFLDRLRLALGRSQRNRDYHFAVLFVDLDRFKTINDSLGHAAGDRLLVAVAERLTECLRDHDVVGRLSAPRAHVGDGGGEGLLARLGGDEFVILLDDVNGPNEAMRVAERIQGALAEPFEIDGRAIYSTASIGIAASSSGYLEVQDIVRDADVAMYRAKTSGRARWELFDRSMHDSALARLQLEAELHRAVREEQFVLCYQPVVSLRDGSIRGFEALIRWRHPARGRVPPGEFIALAEEIGLIGTIGDWVLGEACRQVGEWQRRYAFDPPLIVSVNVSALQLDQLGFIGRIEQILDDSGLPAASLKLELTESAVTRDTAQARELFLRLRSLGVLLSIDDFGTGYSSLGQLRRLPVDTLKVDRSFVAEMDTDDEKRQIAQAVVTMARSLGMTVIAEGAETAGEVAVLRAMACEYVQGFYYYRPLEAAAAEAALTERPAAP